MYKLKNINEVILKNLTDNRSYQRGRVYYYEGKVSDFNDFDDVLTGKVIGTKTYTVKFDMVNLSAHCNCYAFAGGLFCKHLVALILTKIHGEIMLPIQVKVNTHIAKKVDTKDILQQTLNELTKDELIDQIMTLAESHQYVIHYFNELNQEWTKDEYTNLQVKIRRKFHNLRCIDSYVWYDYTDNLDRINLDILQFIQNLPNSRKTLIFILNNVYWIYEKQLTSIDDTDRIIDNLIQQMIGKAVQYFNEIDADLSILWQFTSKKSSFDFGIDIIESIYTNVHNQAILRELSVKIEKTSFKKDFDFNFDNKAAYIVYMRYLVKYDYIKFRELIDEMTEIDASSLGLSISDEILKNKDYDLFIRLFENTKDSYYKEKLQVAYRVTKQWDKLIKMYEAIILATHEYGNVNLDKIRELKQTILKHKDKQYWNVTINKIKRKFANKYIAIDLYLYLKNYDQVYKLVLMVAKNNYFHYNKKNFIEIYAQKFQIIDIKTSIKLYKYLIERELQKFYKSTNYYDNFLRWMEVVWKYGEQEYVNNKNKYILKKFKTRKKLIERMENICIN